MNKKKRFPKSGGLFFTVAVFAFAAAGFLYLNWHRVKPDESEAAVFGGWVYRNEDQKTVAALLARSEWTDYRWDNGRLMVPAAKRGACERILGENKAIPREPSDVKREALTEMTQFESESKTRMRDLYSSARQLEQTLAQFDSIESATVGVWTRREQDGLMPKTITTATVGVQMRQSFSGLTPELVSAITLAAKHQLGIAENDNISIMDLRNGRSYLGDDRAVGLRRLNNSDDLNERYRQEEYWRERFRNTFASIPGLQVTSTVDLADSAPAAVPEPKAPSDEVPALMQAQLGPVESDTGTLVFRPDSTAEIAVPPVPNETFASKQPDRVKKIAVVLGIPENYITETGVRSLESIRQTAESILRSSDAAPENCSVRICLYKDGSSTVDSSAATTAENDVPETASDTAADTADAAVLQADSALSEDETAMPPATLMFGTVEEPSAIAVKAITENTTTENISAENTTAENTAAENKKQTADQSGQETSRFQAWMQTAEMLAHQGLDWVMVHPNESLIGGSASAALMLIGGFFRFFRKKRPGNLMNAAEEGESRPVQDRSLFYLDPADEDRMDEMTSEERESAAGIEIAGRIEDDPRRAAEIIQEWIRSA